MKKRIKLIKAEEIPAGATIADMFLADRIQALIQAQEKMEKDIDGLRRIASIHQTGLENITGVVPYPYHPIKEHEKEWYPVSEPKEECICLCHESQREGKQVDWCSECPCHKPIKPEPKEECICSCHSGKTFHSDQTCFANKCPIKPDHTECSCKQGAATTIDRRCTKCGELIQ